MLTPIVSGIIIFLALSAWLIPHYAVHYMTRSKCSTYERCLEMLEQQGVLTRQQFEACNKEEVSIRSHDGIMLYGWYVEKYPHSRRIALIVHGYTGALPWSAQFMDMFIEQGFNILLVDQRRHGQSEGKYTTFGYKEKYDLQMWVDWLISRKGKDCIIGLHGQSLGGGTVLEYAAIRRPQIQFIVADCPYSDLTQLIHYQVKILNQMPAWPTMALINRLLQRKAGFRMEQVSPIRIMRTCNLPVLFIHGKEDRFVPTWMSEQLYEAKRATSSLILIEGAGHGTAYATNRERYWQGVTSFVQATIGSPSPEELTQPFHEVYETVDIIEEPDPQPELGVDLIPDLVPAESEGMIPVT